MTNRNYERLSDDLNTAEVGDIISSSSRYPVSDGSLYEITRKNGNRIDIIQMSDRNNIISDYNLIGGSFYYIAWKAKIKSWKNRIMGVE